MELMKVYYMPEPVLRGYLFLIHALQEPQRYIILPYCVTDEAMEVQEGQV